MTMSDSDIGAIVQSVLQHDLDPPSEDYGSYDYGVLIAQRLGPEAVAPLIVECLSTLPSGLAGSFIEGVLEGTTVSNLEDLLVDVLPRVREVSSAGVVVGLLVEQRGVRPTEFATQLLARIRGTIDPDEQNRLAYAVYSTFRSDTGGATSPSSTQEGSLDGLIGEVVISANLTDYARDTLERCRRGRGK